MLFIIIIHEFGHLIAASIFNWNIDKISLYPYGGCVKFNEKINRPLYQEFIILISGPLIQIVLFLIISILFKYNLISIRNYYIFKSYHTTLLMFNLLPIYPLDGGKILNVLFNYLFPYKKGNKIIIYISYIIVLFMIINFKNINFILMSIFLITEITLYFKRQNYLFNKFLLERYLYNYKFSKLKIINKKDNMYRERKHLFKVKNKYYSEQEYLKNRFNMEEK